MLRVAQMKVLVLQSFLLRQQHKRCQHARICVQYSSRYRVDGHDHSIRARQLGRPFLRLNETRMGDERVSALLYISYSGSTSSLLDGRCIFKATA